MTHDSTGKTAGIILGNGEKKNADLVVVNADLVWAHNNLFTKSALDVDNIQGKGKSVSMEKGENGLIPEELLNPRLAKNLLDKPHSSVKFRRCRFRY